MKIIAPPEIMPARMPHLLDLFQNSPRSTAGPKHAPKPPQAKDTILNTEESGFSARNTAMTEITITVILAIHMDAFLPRLTLKNSDTMF